MKRPPCVRHPRVWRALAALVVSLGACSPRRAPPEREHPGQLVGRWVLRREDQSWGDTLQLHPAGSVTGSRGNAVPANARWWVEMREGPRFCVSDAARTSCRAWELRGEQLILHSDSSQTVFRRVAPANRAE